MFNLNNFAISTMTIGASTSAIISTILFVGNTGILNTCLNAGTAKITTIKNADASTAHIKIGFPYIPVLNIEFLLSLMLNM